MRKVFCIALLLAVGCDEPRSTQTKVEASSQTMVGKSVIVKPGKDSVKPGLIMIAPPDDGSPWFSPMDVEAFRGVILGEIPEKYHEGKLDDFARWSIKVEDGPATGKVVTVVKKRVDLIPVK